jgi:hypothetical protein
MGLLRTPAPELLLIVQLCFSGIAGQMAEKTLDAYSMQVVHATVRLCLIAHGTCYLFSIDSQRRITVGGPAVHACRSETALGCTMREAGWESFACFTCFACCLLPVPLTSLHAM